MTLAWYVITRAVSLPKGSPATAVAGEPGAGGAAGYTPKAGKRLRTGQARRRGASGITACDALPDLVQRPRRPVEHYGQGMGSYKDVLALAIAALAVVVSLVTIVLQQRQQKREAYRGLYEMLMSEQLQRGRWLIGDVGRKKKLPEAGSSEYYEIYRTLGVFEALAMYNKRKAVPRDWVIRVWHHSLSDMRGGAEFMRDDRLKGNQKYVPWPNLWPLMDDADGYPHKSDMLCCHPEWVTTPPDGQT